MFNYTIDQKPEVTDARGNRIIDLTKSIFARNATPVSDYEVVHMSDVYEMRPDLVSQAMYGTDTYTEFILKFAGISNPFTLYEDDILLIPNQNQAEGMMADNNSGDKATSDAETRMAEIRNFYKFVNTEYKPDKTSYDNLKNTVIPSGVIKPSERTEYMVPYISEDGRTAITIRNNRVYFGEDSGMKSASQAAADLSAKEGVTKSVRSLLEQTQTALSDTNCLYNGMYTTDFFRATQK